MIFHIYGLGMSINKILFNVFISVTTGLFANILSIATVPVTVIIKSKSLLFEVTIIGKIR